jgi:hypothetical protein
VTGSYGEEATVSDELPVVDDWCQYRFKLRNADGLLAVYQELLPPPYNWALIAPNSPPVYVVEPKIGWHEVWVARAGESTVKGGDPVTERTPTCADECRKELVATLARLGTEITASHLKPLVIHQFVQAITCPHGVVWWYEPTSDERAAWIREGRP